MSTYYVSPLGNDAALGTITAPWRTLTASASRLDPGDTLYIRGGTYNEAVNFAASGAPDKRIIVSAYPGEDATIDGQDSIPANVYYFLVQVSGSYVTFRNVPVINSHGGAVAVTGAYSYAVNVSGANSRETGIVAAGAYNILDACSMVNSGWGYGVDGQGTWGSAICTVGVNTIIQNCLSHNNKGEGLNAYSTALNAIIQDNVSYDNGCNAYLDSPNGAIIRRNLLYTSAAAFAVGIKGIGIFIGGETGEPKNLTIVNNLCRGNWLNLVSDSNVETADNWTIANNTFVNAQKTADDIASGYNMNVYFRPQLANFINSRFQNNIILEEDARQVPINTSLVTPHAGFEFAANLWSKAPVSAATGPGDVIGNPLLAQAGGTGAGELTGDYFRITAGSPAISKAAPLDEVADDYFGTARGAPPDIGAHEYEEASMVTKKLGFILEVTAAPDFFPAIDPASRSVAQGRLAFYNITVSAQGGFVGPVALVVSGLPDGAVATFDKPSVNAGETAVLTIATEGVAPGSYAPAIEATAEV
jgi:hypothetical protein